MTDFSVLIPARYQASRLPGKPLREIGGVPLVCRVMERAKASGARRVVVATDDERIGAAVREWGCEAVLTSPECASGTDRLAEAVAALDLPEREPVVNVQGDEPFMPSELIREVAEALDAEPAREMATAAHPLREWRRVLDPNCVKVVTDRQGDALYFSRAPVPWPRDLLGGEWPGPEGPDLREPPRGFWLHIGIYAYRAGFLRAYPEWTPTPLERLESLEQLRALENGVRLRVIECTRPPGLGVDTPEDLAEAERRLTRTDSDALQ
ncbi:3-deoxy-manno-octulosonate cytidylyltransferase [Thiohalorhabdus methylotrophus]|uniref:3-deoxy-manno-octulosonate cytidylyltransferase n=1 Tax=Thiohalorhabdus methylotrophus TaxID=3242694 RepID=A0ABV4TZE4_9GAMM